MFENILGQPYIIERLIQDLENDTLPSSLLFYGSPYSGKLTTALELARILTCKRKGDWICSCSECEQQRLLLHPETIMLGKRYFMREISACAEVFKQYQKQFAQYMFIRSVRKLTRRFHQDFLDESAKSNAIISQAQGLEEIIEEISPPNPFPEKKKIDKLIGKIISNSEKLAAHIPDSGIPVDQVRRLSYWTHTTSASRGKIIILENADALLESSRNALLKILEEPPEKVHFILLSQRKSSIMPTILSRVRPYAFLQRDEKSSGEVLRRIFREESNTYATLQEYFLASGNIDPVHLHNVTEKYISFLTEGGYTEDIYDVIEEISGASKEKTGGLCYLEELLRRLQIVLRTKITEHYQDPLFFNKLHCSADLLHHWQRNIVLLNMQPQKSVETVLYKMIEVFR